MLDPAPLPATDAVGADGVVIVGRAVCCSSAVCRLASSAVARAFAVVSAVIVARRDAARLEA